MLLETLLTLSALALAFDPSGPCPPEAALASPRLPASPGSPPVDWAAFVNPFVGTDGHGHTHPAATLPFGMVQLGPDTRLDGWDGCSGYHYSDDRIYGFSHTHLSGTGVSDYGDVLLMPRTGGELRLNNGADGSPGYAARFAHEEEAAEPGYYRVRLRDPEDSLDPDDPHSRGGVLVELSATARTGLHRYRFPADAAMPRVVLDLAHRDPVLESWVRVVSPTEIEGMRRSRQWASDQHVYFVARFSRPIGAYTLAVDGSPIEEQQGGPAPERASGTDVRADLRFPGASELLVQVALSAVDVDGARRNLEAEAPAWDFDGTRARARETWNMELGRIAVEGADAADGRERARLRTFYTALYHSLLAPNLFSDVDGRFRGMDGDVHSADHDVYTVFSLWDTFRAAHPLFTLIQRERTLDFLRTFERHFETGGKLPIWELAGNETGCMIGNHAIAVIADAWLKGIEGFDQEKLYAAMKASADDDVLGLDAYKRSGYVPADHESESVSKTLEYAYDDWCIARVAESLGRVEDAARFDRRARAYQHLFDPVTGFLRPRRNGAWITPFDPREVNFHFTEANAWQYTFFVPHDIAGLMALMGGQERFRARLDELFSADSSTTGREQADITGLIGQYAHGNEPSHHVAWLYHYVGEPWKTQELVERILNELYDDGPAGLSGNEDCGQMSAWYVLSALGIYPVCPGTNEYALIAPQFERSSLHLENGRTFTFAAARPTPEHRWVQDVLLNGEALERSALEHAAIESGGLLQYTLGPSPSQWGVSPAARPRSAMPEGKTVSVPYVEAEAQVFREALEISLGHHDPEVSIHFTLDGSTPSTTSAVYTTPLTLRESTELGALAAKPGLEPSPAIEARFHRIDHSWNLRLESEYSTQYTAGGDLGLIDGLRGGHDFRTGSWQGYLGQDLVAVLDLGSVRPLTRVSLGFLQEVRSWIWLPSALEVEVSTDGEHWQPAGRATHDVPLEDYEARVRALEVELGVDARYLRLRAVDGGPIPDWHPGQGHPRWIFADEILVE